MSSTESWLAFAIRNIPALLGHYCYHAPDTTNQGTLGDIASFRRERRAVAESPLSQFNQQGRRRLVTAENLSAWIAASWRSGMNKYELIRHLRELDFRDINQLFAKLLGLANGMHEEIYSQHPIYLSILSSRRVCGVDGNDSLH